MTIKHLLFHSHRCHISLRLNVKQIKSRLIFLENESFFYIFKLMKSASFELPPPLKILNALPLLTKLIKTGSEDILKEYLLEISQQNYECIGVYDSNRLIGIAELWFQTRYYSGKRIEPEHVIIHENYLNKDLVRQLLDWIDNYVKGDKAIKLNSYINNTVSHQFYYNEAFKILGFHFVKRLDK